VVRLSAYKVRSLIHTEFSAMADVKPDISGEAMTIKIKYNESTTVFRVKGETLFCKVTKAYCDKVGHPITSMRFMFDGERINDDKQSISELGLEDGDTVDAFLQQVGGSLASGLQ
jgi:small ubiquitin-related modifier